MSPRKESTPKNLIQLCLTFDTCSGQSGEPVSDALENKILVVKVPGKCMDRLQPLDLLVNKPAKHFCAVNLAHSTVEFC